MLRPKRQWTDAGNSSLSGVFEGSRFDAGALGLVSLRLEERGVWNPAEHYWGEDGEPIEKWATPVIARGPRSTTRACASWSSRFGRNRDGSTRDKKVWDFRSGGRGVGVIFFLCG